MITDSRERYCKTTMEWKIGSFVFIVVNCWDVCMKGLAGRDYTTSWNDSRMSSACLARAKSLGRGEWKCSTYPWCSYVYGRSRGLKYTQKKEKKLLPT